MKRILRLPLLGLLCFASLTVPSTADAALGDGKRAFARAEKKGAVEAYEKFLRKHPHSAPYSETARDRLMWHETKKDDSRDAYRDYLRRFPDGEHAWSAEGSIKMYAIMDDAQVTPRERVAMLRQLYADYGRVATMSYQMASFLGSIYFTNTSLLLSSEEYVDGSSLYIGPVNIASSSEYEVYAAKVERGEVVYACDSETLRTLHSITDKQLMKIATGTDSGKAGVPCNRGGEYMIGMLLGKEAFGELDDKIKASDALVDFLPKQLARSVTLTQSVGTYRKSGGLLPDIVGGGRSVCRRASSGHGASRGRRQGPLRQPMS